MMLKIGDFSRIAGVSVRLLRYYEELGLFNPAYIDSVSGYRYYESAQIINLNKILALKDLGLTLQEIKLYIDEEISRDELAGMLKLKKSQVYQSIEDELLRLRRIEYRLKQLEEQEMPSTKDVIIKPIVAQQYLSIRDHALPINDFSKLLGNLMMALSSTTQKPSGTITILEHSQTFPDETFDLEIGFALPLDKSQTNQSLALDNHHALSPRELPAINQMATLLHIGPWGSGMQAYHALGRWIEAHGFEICGATREVYHEMAITEDGNNIVEFQLPIQSVERLII